MTDLTAQRCKACEAGIPPLEQAKIDELLHQCPTWVQQDRHIERTFGFKGYGKTMAFVNAIAWIAHKEGHHPDLYVTYNSCKVMLTTHAIDGLSDNDFIMAAKINQLVSL